MFRCINNVFENIYYPESKRGKTDVESNIYNMMQKANQKFDIFSFDENIFKQALSIAYEHKELLLKSDRLSSEWKTLSINTAKYIDLPFESELLKVIKKVNAFISQQFYFSPAISEFNDDAFNSIMLHIQSPHNSYVSQFSSELAALASVSKKWDFAIYQMQLSNALEHGRLTSLGSLNLTAGCKTAEEAVDFIIQKQLEVANLTKFKNLTEELLEKLFKNNPNLKHLSIKDSELITQLPVLCKQLRTLSCISCYNLESLPDMPQLTNLDCRGCSIECLAGLLQLKDLTCSNCDNLKYIQNLPQLRRLKCNDCYTLLDLSNLPNLTSLYCCECKNLTTISNLPQLRYLECGGSAIESLPELPNLITIECGSLLTSLPELPNLTSLDCYGQFINLPELPSLTRLDCTGCYKLTSLPQFLNLTSLTYGSCKELSCLPDLPKLKHLCCSGNHLFKSLPDLPELKNLKCFDFDFTHLEEIVKPNYFKQIKSLELSRCKQISSLPALPKLKNLAYENCPNLIINLELLPQDCHIISNP